MLPMNAPDLYEAKAMHRAGLLPLRAAAWVLVRYREQIPGRTATADEVVETFGCHRVSAFRALREIRAFQVAASDATHKPVAETDTGVRSSDIGYSATTPVAESATQSSGIGYPPTPPYKERELGNDTHIGVAESATRLWDGICGAVAILRENLQTEPLGNYLSRNAHLPEVRSLAEDTGKDGEHPAGWRLESAAMKFLSPRIPDDVRSCRDCRASLNYLLAIARGLTAPYVPPSLAATGADPRPQSPAARRRSEADALIDSPDFLARLEAAAGGNHRKGAAS